MRNLTRQNKRLNKSQNENAITLVALIITIIILIILAAVTITSLTHNDLAKMAIEGTQKYDKAQTDEMNMLNEIDTMVKETVKNLQSGVKPEEPEPKITWVTSSDNKQVPVPIGYIAPTVDSEKSVDGGFVIRDAETNGNEWVWVPVDETTYNSMFVTETVALSGSTGVSTAKYSASNIISGIARVKSGDTSSFREPDLVTSYDNDANAQTAGFANLADMATKMTSEYSTMLASIQKYGGFYIGRYELTANGSKSGAPLTNTNWYNLYNKCTKLSADNTKATTRMIWRMSMGRYM